MSGDDPMECCTSNDCCSGSGRNFLTAQEKVERLTKYKEWLTKEAKGVEEAIEKVQKK